MLKISSYDVIKCKVRMIFNGFLFFDFKVLVSVKFNSVMLFNILIVN